MSNVIARPLPSGIVIDRECEVVRVESAFGTVTVRLSAPEGRDVEVIFEDVWGYRVMDERDLSEYWPVCSAPNGRLFEVESGGWLSQEASRDGFVSAAVTPNLKEFFIAGIDDCVSVLCTAEPAVCAHAL